MQFIWNGIWEAIQAIASGDAQIYQAAFRSLWISLSAVGLASLVGIPIGISLSRSRFRGKSVLVTLFRAGMAFPTVFVGLVCYALLSRQGPLGPLDLLYTPWAIIFGEFVLALPIIVSLTHGAVSVLDPRIDETAFSLGATRFQRWRLAISEARTGIKLALMTAFARCVTELGIAMMVGGNLKDRTRTLSTATALETSKGEFTTGMAMGVVLLLIALVVATFIGWLSREKR